MTKYCGKTLKSQKAICYGKMRLASGHWYQKCSKPSLKEKQDTLAEVTTAEGKQFIVRMERQSTNDMQMASRMTLYDLLLHQAYQKDVMGMIQYVGNEKMRMADSISFSEFHYRCQIIDVRRLDPEIFL